MYLFFNIPNWLKRLIFLHLCWVLPISAWSQKPSDFFKTTDNNYGQLENGATLLSVFPFTNNTGKPLFVLSAKGSRFVTVEFSRRPVAPGATDSIVLRYQPQSKGAFKEVVEVVLSALDKPVKLEISGSIKNYNQDFLTQCYRYGSAEQPGVFRFEHTGLVIDAVTGKPIPGAIVQIVDIGGLRGDIKTNRTGTYSKDITPGLYEFIVVAPNYIGVGVNDYFQPSAQSGAFHR